MDLVIKKLKQKGFLIFNFINTTLMTSLEVVEIED